MLTYFYSLLFVEFEVAYDLFNILDWLLYEGVSIVEGVSSISDPFLASTNLLYNAGITKFKQTIRLCNLSYPYISASTPF
jgi:hypothetical protein